MSVTARARHRRVGDDPEPPARRRLPDPTYLVAAAVVAGLSLTWLHHPRLGMYVVAAAFAAGALLRLVLPKRDAGLLALRHRALDVVVLGGLAAGIAVLATVTPFPPAAS